MDAEKRGGSTIPLHVCGACAKAHSTVLPFLAMSQCEKCGDFCCPHFMGPGVRRECVDCRAAGGR